VIEKALKNKKVKLDGMRGQTPLKGKQGAGGGTQKRRCNSKKGEAREEKGLGVVKTRN